MGEKFYTVKEISNMYHITPRTLQFYDDTGVLKCTRKENNYRAYSEDNLYTLDTILLLKGCGLDLSEIKHYLYKANREEQDDILQIARDKLEQQKQQIELSIKRLDYRREELKSLNKIIPGKLFEAERNKQNLEFIPKENYEVKKNGEISYHTIPIQESYLISVIDENGNFIKACNILSKESYQYEKIAYAYFPYQNNFKDLLRAFKEMTKDYKIKDEYYYTVPILTEKNEYYHYFEIILEE